MARILLPAITLAVLAGCQSMTAPASPQALLESRSGSTVTGMVSLSPSAEGVLVTATVTGLKPGAEHGFHIHEKGDCSAPDATSAGGHFNPTGQPHGAPHGAHHGAPHGASGSAHHAGDMPNLRADSDGTAVFKTTLRGLSLDGPSGVMGKSIVVHRDPDDHRSQPAGNSGPRVACGVIKP